MPRKSKKALIDLEFLVNLIRGLIVLVVIFFLAAAVFNIFFQDNEEEAIKENFLGLIDTIENMPPNFGPILYSIDLGDVNEYSIINSLGSSSTIKIEDPICSSNDCLCLCNGRREECETPIICKRVKSKLDNTMLKFFQYRSNKAPYVEIFTREFHKENKKFPSVMLKRSQQEIAICDSEACKIGYYCDCFIGIDKKTSEQTIENLKNAILKCSLEAQGINNELEQEAITIYDNLEMKPRIYFYPIENNQDVKEDLVEVYELNKGIPNKIDTYQLETETGKFKWLWAEQGQSHNLLGMFKAKLESSEKSIIFCDQLNENLIPDYNIDLGNSQVIEAGYCMYVDEKEQTQDWDEKVAKVNQMIEQGNNIGEYYFEIPLPEETIDEDTQEISDENNDNLDAEIAESTNNNLYELKLDYNIKPYIIIKSQNKLVYSSIIPEQDGPDTYILPDFNILNIKVFRIEKDKRDLLFFTPHVLLDENTHSFVSLFSLNEQKLLEIYDKEEEVNEGASKIKLNLLQNKIQDTVKGNKLSCNEPVSNTLIESNKDPTKGWTITIKKDTASMEYTGPEKDHVDLYKSTNKKQYPLNLNCYVDHLGNYHSNVDQILITPLDKDLTIVKLESGEVCLHKKSDIFFKGKYK
jgi:hypothetical protein